jgi:hypothetical protein
MPGTGPEPPSAQSPFARLGRYLRRRGVTYPVGEHYPAVFATTGSRARPATSLRLGLKALNGWSLPVAVSPGWQRDVPDLISADPSPDAWTPTPAVPKVHVLVSSLRAAAFPSV